MNEREWHLWPVAALAFAWHLAGAADYLALRSGLWLDLGLMTPDQAADIAGLPLWQQAGWAAGVWGGLAGAVLLIGGARHAALWFLVAAVGLAPVVLGLWLRPETIPNDVSGPLLWAYWLLPVPDALFFLYARMARVRARQR